MGIANRKLHAFMTIQIVIFICIYTLLITNIYYVLSAVNKQLYHYNESQRIDYIANALRNFALANGYLPYPAKIVDGRSSGESVASPQDESAWIGGAKSEYIYGAIPYTTINIPEHIVHTNHGCIEYIVNPTLCSRGTTPKRQDMSACDTPQIFHIPPGDPRIHIDRYKNDQDRMRLMYTGGIFNTLPKAQTSDFPENELPVPMQHYSSISCVRGYMPSYPCICYDKKVTDRPDKACIDRPYKGYVTCWDLASNIDAPSIKLPDGKNYAAQTIEYAAIDASLKNIRTGIEEWRNFYRHMMGHLLKFVYYTDAETKPTHSIKNVFAFAIAPPKSIRIDNDNVYHIGSTRYRILSRADILGPLFGGIYYVLC